MGNWSLVLLTSITVGSGPSNTSSLVSAECPVEEGISRPDKLVQGGYNRLGRQLPYLEGLVPEQYKWWEAPEDIHSVKISITVQEFDLWIGKDEFFNIFMKIEATWEDFRLLTSNMTRHVLYSPSDDGIWTPILMTSWKEEKTCTTGKSLKVYKNNSLVLKQNLKLKRR